MDFDPQNSHYIYWAIVDRGHKRETVTRETPDARILNFLRNFLSTYIKVHYSGNRYMYYARQTRWKIQNVNFPHFLYHSLVTDEEILLYRRRLSGWTA